MSVANTLICLSLLHPAPARQGTTCYAARTCPDSNYVVAASIKGTVPLVPTPATVLYLQYLSVPWLPYVGLRDPRLRTSVRRAQPAERTRLRDAMPLCTSQTKRLFPYFRLIAAGCKAEHGSRSSRMLHLPRRRGSRKHLLFFAASAHT